MFPIALVRWADAHQGTSGWTDISDLEPEGERIIISSGFLVDEDSGGKKDHVTLIQSWDESQESVDNAIHIPVAMVREVVTVGDATQHGQARLLST